MSSTRPRRSDVAAHGDAATARADGRHPLVVVVTAAAAGIVVDVMLPLSAPTWWLLALAAWIAWWRVRRTAHETLGVVVLLISVAAIAACWHHQRWYDFRADDLGLWASSASQPICIEAVALSAPRVDPPRPPDPLRSLPAWERSEVALRVVGLRDGQQWCRASGITELSIDGRVPGIRAGDRVRVFATLLAPTPAENPGGFDLARYLRVDRQLCSLRTPHPECVEVITPGGWWSPRRWLAAARRASDAVIGRALDPQQAGLAAALLLGQRQQLDQQEIEAFVETGTLHLLVVSGLHVGLLAAGLFGLMRLGLVPRRGALVMVATLTMLYAALTGANPPVVRATVMVIVFCAATWLGRRGVNWNTLAAAALVVLAINPCELFQTGTQLSFLAVASLIWIAGVRFGRPPDALDRLIAGSRPWPIRVGRRTLRWAGRLAVASLVVWLATLPLVMARFHVVTPLSPLLNVVLWLPVSLALLCGFGMFVFGWIAPPVATILAQGCEACVGALAHIVTTTAQLPVSHFWVPGPSIWWVVGLYAILAGWLVVPQLRLHPRWCVGLVAAWIVLALANPILRHTGLRDDSLRCTFLAVGHGSAVVVELPDGRTLLYDAGRLGSPWSAARSVGDYLWHRGITHLDAVVVSHADVDHYNALPELLRRFSVGVVYVSPMMFEGEGAALDALSNAFDQHGVRLVELHAPDNLAVGGGTTIEVLHPTRFGVLGSDNANSIVLAIEHRGRRILLTGDLETPGLEAVLAEAPWDADILLAPHHGSPRSNPQGFAAWSTPEFVIGSGSPADVSTELEGAYRAAGASVLQTSQRGAIVATIDASGLRVEPFR